MTSEFRKKVGDTVISELVKLLVLAIIAYAAWSFFLRPFMDENMKAVREQTTEIGGLKTTITNLTDSNKLISVELENLKMSIKDQKEIFNKYIYEQTTNLRTQGLKLAYNKLFDTYHRNAGSTLINKSASEIGRLQKIRDELTKLADQITGTEASTAKFIFNNDAVSESIGKLYGSIYYAHLVRFLEDILWRVYGDRGECTEIEEFGLCVSQIESDFLINSGIGEEWFFKTLADLTEDDVNLARNALSKLGILLEGAEDLEAVEIKDRFYKSLGQSLKEEELMQSFANLPGQPRVQFSIYLALYDSGLLDLRKALLKYSPDITKEYLGGIFDENLELISFAEIEELASNLEAFIRTSEQISSEALINEITIAKNNTSSLIEDDKDIDAILINTNIENFFINTLRWAVKKSDSREDLVDKIAIFLGKDGKASTYVTALSDLENIYNIIENRLLIEASLPANN